MNYFVPLEFQILIQNLADKTSGYQPLFTSDHLVSILMTLMFGGHWFWCSRLTAGSAFRATAGRAQEGHMHGCIHTASAISAALSLEPQRWNFEIHCFSPCSGSMDTRLRTVSFWVVDNCAAFNKMLHFPLPYAYPMSLPSQWKANPLPDSHSQLIQIQ